MGRARRLYSFLVVGLSAFTLFALPISLFLLRFRQEAPFFFLAEDSFYYLSIASHSARVRFFTLDGSHPTNGFHPLWEWCLSALSHSTFFDLASPSVLARYFGLNIAIVGTAVALLSITAYRFTRRPWVALVATCPGLLWLLTGIGAPAYLNFWGFVNGMETGVELLCFGLALCLLSNSLQGNRRHFVAAAALGLLVLARLDDVFLLLAIAAVSLFNSPRGERGRKGLSFLLPALLIAAYLLYNHRTVGVWMPVSGMAKVGKGYRAGIGESLRLLRGWPFFALPPWSIAFSFSNVFVIVAEMLAPMAIAAVWLVRPAKGRFSPSPLLRALAIGVLCKGLYNFLRVPIGYQGAWYYGVPIATANLFLALYGSEVLDRLRRTLPEKLAPLARPTLLPPVAHTVRFVALLCLSFLSFNVVAARASENGFAVSRDTWLERFRLRQALQAATRSPFLEFQDGELSFATGLPAVSGFGLAADPAAVSAQKEGRFFALLAQRGVTVAAASNLYPSAIATANATQDKTIFAVWGFNRHEIQGYCFQPFWYDPDGNITLYHIVHQPRCAAP